jgi:hypothetical protein
MLWHLKLGVVVSLLLALLAAVWSVQKISLSPLGLTPRSLEMATATTHVVIDTPTSSLLDLRQDTYELEGLQNRTVLLGNVLASTQVEANIARRAHVPIDLLRIQAPLTAAVSSPPADSQNARHTSDILKSTEQYRLDFQANPLAPMLDVYAQAPSATAAAALANSAVAELQSYLDGLAATQQIARKFQVHPLVLGKAKGVVINKGIDWQVAFLVFILTFAVACATAIYLSRVRTGWRQAVISEQAAVV